MGKTAILYGIHANLPALEAVAEDARRCGADRFVCLGATVARGPYPVECCRWVLAHCHVVLAGNWEWYLANDDLLKFSSATLTNETLRWNRKLILQEPDGDAVVRKLGGLPGRVQEGPVLYVGGAISDTASVQYQWSRDLAPYTIANVREVYDSIPDGVRLVLSGVRGGPSVVWPSGKVEHALRLTETIASPADGKLIVNVGGISPRDGDPRACYVILDDGRVTFRRVAYDVERLVAAFEFAVEVSPEVRAWMVEWHRLGV